MMTMPFESGISVVRGRHGGGMRFTMCGQTRGSAPTVAVSVTRAAGSLNFKLFTSRFARWSAPTAQRLRSTRRGAFRAKRGKNV